MAIACNSSQFDGSGFEWGKREKSVAVSYVQAEPLDSVLSRVLLQNINNHSISMGLVNDSKC